MCWREVLALSPESNPGLLVSADWLQAHLDDPRVHVVDTSVDIVPRPPGPSDYRSRHPDYLEAHIPGAAYLHMVEDLSDPEGPFPFALPTMEQVSARLRAIGVSAGDTVVVYGNQIHWATHRCWWVLAVAGVDARVLDCRFDVWVAEGRPTETGRPEFTTGDFTASPKDSWVASREDVRASLDEPGTALINALSAEQFAGRGQPFGRPGRIPGSISVPAAEMIDPSSGAFRAATDLRAAFEASGAFAYDHLITYCGGGIAASTSFLALKLLGYPSVALYDGSLLDWSTDPNLPLIVD